MSRGDTRGQDRQATEENRMQLSFSQHPCLWTPHCHIPDMKSPTKKKNIKLCSWDELNPEYSFRIFNSYCELFCLVLGKMCKVARIE